MLKGLLVCGHKFRDARATFAGTVTAAFEICTHDIYTSCIRTTGRMLDRF